MDCVSSAFCCANATATAAAMVLASEASLDSWSLSRLWFSAAAFSSLDRLPITRFGSVCRKTVFYGVLCFRTWARSSEALYSSIALKLWIRSSEALVLVVADLD